MAVQIESKSKKTTQIAQAQVEKASASETQLAATVDVYADAARAYKAARAHMDQLEGPFRKAENDLVNIYETLVDDDETRVLAGNVSTVRMGGRAMVRTLKAESMSEVFRLFNKVQKGLFLECCTMALGMMDKHLNDIERAKILDEARTGKRKITIL